MLTNASKRNQGFINCSYERLDTHMSNVNFEKLFVTGEDGVTVDVEATRTVVLEQLDAAIEQDRFLREQRTLISEAVIEVLTAAKGERLGRDVLVGRVLGKMDVPGSQSMVVSKEILKFISDNSGDHDELDKLFHSKKGPGQGVTLMTDELRAEEAAKAAKAAAKAAKAAAKK